MRKCVLCVRNIHNIRIKLELEKKLYMETEQYELDSNHVRILQTHTHTRIHTRTHTHTYTHNVCCGEVNVYILGVLG